MRTVMRCGSYSPRAGRSCDPLPVLPLNEEGEWSVFMEMLYASKVNAQRELQSASGEELRPLFGRTLMSSILDKAFKGEL